MRAADGQGNAIPAPSGICVETPFTGVVIVLSFLLNPLFQNRHPLPSGTSQRGLLLLSSSCSGIN